jgi:N utilization substance protein B
MSRRSRAREVALQVLFQDDLNPVDPPPDAISFLNQRLTTADLVDLATTLVVGVRRNRDQLDQLLQTAAENWTVSRMAATDRNVLRLGAFELLYMETPNRVSVDEAVELAKRFGSAQSASFVNGILDRLLNTQNPSPE